MLGDHGLTGKAAHGWLVERVAIIAAIEHVTPFLGDWILNAHALDPVSHAPADRSALSVIAAARPGTAYSCRQGFCGTCRVRVLAGEVAHHSSGTARRTDDAMLICVSRAAEPGGRLTLDL